jgi:hypothetical protein
MFFTDLLKALPFSRQASISVIETDSRPLELLSSSEESPSSSAKDNNFS